MKHQMKPGLSQNKNGVTKPHGQAFVLRSSSGRNKPRVAAVEVLCHTSPPNEIRDLTGWSTDGYSSEDCGGNHEPRSFLSGYRFFWWAPTKIANWTSQVFRRSWVSWESFNSYVSLRESEITSRLAGYWSSWWLFRSRNPASKNTWDDWDVCFTCHESWNKLHSRYS